MRVLVNIIGIELNYMYNIKLSEREQSINHDAKMAYKIAFDRLRTIHSSYGFVDNFKLIILAKRNAIIVFACGKFGTIFRLAKSSMEYVTQGGCFTNTLISIMV